MNKLTHEDLMTLEAYSRERKAFRDKVIAHKKNRKIHLGENATLYFEDRLTMQYQIQEMLRIERIFEADAIQDELDAYNPLIPDGNNLKATFMVEFPDPEERRVQLARLTGIEDTVWLQVDGGDKVKPVMDEDLDRGTAEKTSAVHFARFEFTQAMIDALRGGAGMRAGIDHENYRADVRVPAAVRDSLAADLGAA